MSVSVCIAAFNGERFIETQLFSIMRQTRQPDEVIICDDCSQDRTVEKTRDFIARHHLEDRWRLIQNVENKGYPENFYYVMGLCTSDIVLLADQDDVWAETKLEKMLSVMEQYPEANVVACKFGLIDSGDRKIHTVMGPSRSLGTGKVHRIGIYDIFYKYEWPGMVLAYRNKWYEGCEKGGAGIPHDIFICAKAAESHTFFQVDEVLAYHRRHEKNTAAEEHRVGKLLHKKRKLWEIEKYIEMLRLFKEQKVLRTEEGRQALMKKCQVMEGRYDALLSGQISRVLKEAFLNRKNVRFATVICDLLIVKNNGL